MASSVPATPGGHLREDILWAVGYNGLEPGRGRYGGKEQRPPLVLGSAAEAEGGTAEGA